MSADKRQRRSLRLRGYDYAAPGWYYVSICTQSRACLFGDIANGEMCLNENGRSVETAWEGLPDHYPRVRLDAWVIMPNHVHGILALVEAGFKPASMSTVRHGLPEIVRAFKTFSARRINAVRGTPGTSVWQRNYYEHIIRDDADLNRIRQYIWDNPARWHEDPENPYPTRRDHKSIAPDLMMPDNLEGLP